MSDQKETHQAQENDKTDNRAFIRNLIIGKVIFLIIMAGVGYYLFITI